MAGWSPPEPCDIFSPLDAQQPLCLSRPAEETNPKTELLSDSRKKKKRDEMDKQLDSSMDSTSDRPSAGRFGHAAMPEEEKIEGEEEGVIHDARYVGLAEKRGLKLVGDGYTILLPQPSSDPKDPLNWPWSKKHAAFLLPGFAAFCGEFFVVAANRCDVKQALDWGVLVSKIDETGDISTLMLAIGPFLWVPLTGWWGRVPIIFWTTFLAAFLCLGCALAQSYEAYYVLRTLSAFIQSSGFCTALAVIKETFFFHEQAQKIGILFVLALIGPYLGAVVGTHMIAKYGEWTYVIYVVFTLTTLCWILVLLYGDETFYNRSVSPDVRPIRGSRLWRVIGTWQIGCHRGYFFPLKDVVISLKKVLFKPLVPVLMVFFLMTFMWSISIFAMTTKVFELPIIGYGFSASKIGVIGITPIVAILLGGCFAIPINDYLAKRYISNHQGRFKPESRLSAAYIAGLLMIAGLILIGQALQKTLHYSSIIIGWGMFVFGVVLSTIIVTTYALDCFPGQEAQVNAFMNFGRLGGVFASRYFLSKWGEEMDYDRMLGIQAGIVGAAFVLLAFVQSYGPMLRRK